MKKRCILVLCAIIMFFTVGMRVEATQEISETMEPHVTIEAVNNKIVMRKELGIAKVPLIVPNEVLITEVTSNQADFEATYEDGMLYVIAHNVSTLPDHSDCIVNFTIKGTDPHLLPFENILQITFQVESKISVEAIMDEEEEFHIGFLDSYNRTLHLNEYDRRLIAQSNIDFSEYTIACIGDSITAGAGVESGMENRYSYPADLQRLLGAEQVLNLGRGGTSIASYWDSFLASVGGIPEDVDIIVVLGGVNDCYAGNEDNIGNFAECKSGTFYGDTDFLMKDLKERYPDAMILFCTPISTITNITYLSFLPDMLSLSFYADAINELGEKNDIPVLDLYYEQFLDSHDENIMQQFMYDGVHPNVFGYQLLAEHIAGEIIRVKKE